MNAMTDTTAIALPRWQSNKIVAADKIVSVVKEFDAQNPAGPQFVEKWTLECGMIVSAGGSLRSRVPETGASGGYYLRYDGGFEMWASATEFEAGFTRIGQ